MLRGIRVGHPRPIQPAALVAVGLHRVVVRVRPPAPPGPVQRERVEDRPGAGLQMEVVEAPQHRLAVRPHRRRVRLAANQPDAASRCAHARQCGRAGLPATCIHRQKSRASTRVARSHATPIAHKNRNQRSRSIPYERTVAAARPAACRSPKNSDTASTSAPAGSVSRNGSDLRKPGWSFSQRVTWPSASCAWQATPASPRPCGTPRGTPNARSACSRAQVTVSNGTTQWPWVADALAAVPCPDCKTSNVAGHCLPDRKRPVSSELAQTPNWRF